MKNAKTYYLFFIGLFTVAQASAQVDSVVWNFNDNNIASFVTDITWANYSCTPFISSSGNDLKPSSTSPSSGYAGVSSGNNIAVACPAAGTYIQWTMEPDPGKEISLSYIEFGVRSTGTGAKRWTLQSSKDNYTTDLVTGTMAADSKWGLQKSAVSFAGGVGNIITFRLFFDNATGSNTALNTRIDDVKIRTEKSALEPKIRISSRHLDFVTAVGVPNSETFTLQGLLLTQNVSVTSTNPMFKVDKSSVSYAAANAAAQAVTVTFDGTQNGASGKIILKTTAQSVEITDTVSVVGATSSSAYIQVSIPPLGKIDFPSVMLGGLTAQMVEITGHSLADSISVIPPHNTAFALSAAKLRKNADRDYLLVYYRPLVEEVVDDTLILRCRGVADVRLPIHAQAVRVRTDLLPPTAYYDAAENKTGAVLKTALYNAIKGHTIVPYSEAWTAYGWLDIRPECDVYLPDASVWDIYTDRPGCLPDNSRCTPNFTNPVGTTCSAFKVLRIGTDQTSTTNPGGSEEGKSYEREHTFPKGWWAATKNSSGAYRESSPMYCDLFHLYPCDHRVNNLRNDNPYGEVTNPTTTFTNGSKLGQNTAGNTYNGTAYEPIDEYKGDIARNYFYMVTRYENTVGDWSKNITWGGPLYDSVVSVAPGLHVNASPMIDTNSYPVFKPWAHDMLLRWHRLDPVSEKELQRNQTIYDKYQHNRNPYIDHPELVEYIWGDSIGKAWHPLVTDTIKDTTIVVNPPASDTIQKTVCGSYMHNDSVYTASGTYYQHFTNANGDSTLVIILKVNQPTDSTIREIICDSITINSSTYYAAGEYTQALVNAAGCDSMLTIILTANSCDTIPVDTITAIGKIQNVEFSLFPNPNAGEFTIVLQNGDVPTVVDVYSASGVLYPCVSVGAQRYRINAPEGIYFVRVVANKGSAVRKFHLAR